MLKMTEDIWIFLNCLKTINLYEDTTFEVEKGYIDFNNDADIGEEILNLNIPSNQIHLMKQVK